MKLKRVGVGLPVNMPGDYSPTTHVVAREGIDLYWEGGLIYVWKKGVELPEIIPASNVASMTPLEAPKRK